MFLFLFFLDLIKQITAQAGLVLLVPIQYFLGIVCFLSKTLLTKNAVCPDTRGHISLALAFKTLTAGCFTAIQRDVARVHPSTAPV